MRQRSGLEEPTELRWKQLLDLHRTLRDALLMAVPEKRAERVPIRLDPVRPEIIAKQSPSLMSPLVRPRDRDPRFQ